MPVRVLFRWCSGLSIQFAKGNPCCMQAAHPVNPGAWGSRSRAKVDPFQRRPMIHSGRPKNQLFEILCTSSNIAADQVRVVLLEFCGTEGVAREDALPESGSESLDLRFEVLSHIFVRPMGDVAGISPGRMFSRRGAGRIKEA